MPHSSISTGVVRAASRGAAVTFLVIEGFASLSIAMAIFAVDVWVFKTTGSYEVFASLALLAALPSVMVSPLAGPIIDRIPRGTTILACSLLGLAAGCGAALYAQAQGFSVTAAALLMLTLAVVQTVRWPTLLATVSMLAPPGDVERVSAYEESVEAAIMVAAPILGGAVMEHLGLGMVFTLITMPFIASLCGVFLLRLPKDMSLEKLAAIFRHYAANFWPDVTFGFKWIHSRKNILRLLIYICILNFGATIFVTMQVPLALLLFTPKQVAAIMACGGIGLIAGGMVVSIAGAIRPLERAIYLGSAGITLGIAIYAVSSTVVQSAVGAFVFMFFHPFVNTAAQVLWRKNTPAEQQGAIFSVRRMFTSALAPFAIALSVPISVHLVTPVVQGLAGVMPVSAIWPSDKSAALGFTLVLVALSTWLLIFAFQQKKFLETHSS
jgi:MFS family permease